ncbi:MAG: metal-dependent hydrolase [Polyangiaceae bacterium]
MITTRKLSFPFGPDIPRHWLIGSPFATHLVNGLNVLFPAGERFFIRSVRRYAHVIEGDARLQADVRDFFAQEGIHAREHDRFIRLLEEEGFDLTRFMSIFELTLRGAFTPKLSLAVTVALEHFTATFAELVLSRGTMVEDAHPVMRDLLLWHASEELEHKSVAFDVLKKVDPSYALRMAGLVVGSGGLLAFWWAATLMLLRQDDEARAGRALTDAASPRVRADLRGLSAGFLSSFVDYLRPGFHPQDRNNLSLAESYLKTMGPVAQPA